MLSFGRGGERGRGIVTLNNSQKINTQKCKSNFCRLGCLNVSHINIAVSIFGNWSLGLNGDFNFWHFSGGNDINVLT